MEEDLIFLIGIIIIRIILMTLWNRIYIWKYANLVADLSRESTVIVSSGFTDASLFA